MMAKPKATGKTPGMSQELLARINNDTAGSQIHGFADSAFWFSDDSNITPPPGAGPPPPKTKKPKVKHAVNLTPTSEDWAWLTALDQLDRLGDERPLQQLRKVCDPSPRIKKYLLDLDERRAARLRAKKGRGRRRLPAYTLSRNDALLLIADECVTSYIRRDHLSVAKALDKVRDEWAWVPLNRSTLAAVHDRCHASLNKHRKRL